MSSPIKRRPALAGKSINVKPTGIAGSIHKSNHSSNNSSPSKKSQVELSHALRHSPIRNVTGLSPKRNINTSVSSFTFHEETPGEKAATLMEHMSLVRNNSITNDENDFHQVKENMSPSKLERRAATRQQSKRVPLEDLSIEHHRGYIEDPMSHEMTPLTLHYKNKTRLPNFVTPPRDNKLKQCFSYNADADSKTLSRSTDDIPDNKVVRKLNFKISENQ